MMRALVPELLDLLPADDPRAVRSRRDLVRINRIMLQHRIMARALAQLPPPRLLADLGGGDGRFLLKVARRLSRRWPGVTVMIADQKAIVGADTRAAFTRLGWRCESLTGNVFDTLPLIRPDIVTANLFLHHLEDGELIRLLALIASHSKAFVACEPRRSALAMLGARLVFALGANAVTRHDAVASVAAGFRGRDLSSLWPQKQGWRLSERGALPFTHLFAARAREPDHAV
jgi:hypothetical protein